MWAKGRFSYMAEFATKAIGLGFTHIEASASISPQMFSELIEATVPISSIHSHCPTVMSSRGIPISSLSLSSLDKNKRIEAVSFTKKTINLHLHDIIGISDYQAPGEGDMNWEMGAKYLPSGIVKICEIHKWNNEEQIQGVVNLLHKKGILN